MVPVPEMIVGGKYRLAKPIAKGGMGSVWLGQHTELDVPVAVKFMASEIAGTSVARTRFKREAKAAAQLRSPHVVGIQDYGVEDGTPYMVMELLEGEDLRALLDREKRLSIPRIAGIVTQVAKALAMAHAAGIVHRDLKPSNLFLARAGDDEIVKVLDFGVAKEMSTLAVDRTTSGMLVGSPMYMSPEQARGEAIDFRSDLWSLGVVVYEALVGRPPFVSDHLGALLARIHEANVERPSSIASDLPEEVDAFVARALARQPEARFASAKEMADALAAIAESRAPSGAATSSGSASSSLVSPRAGVTASFADRDTELPGEVDLPRVDEVAKAGDSAPKSVGRDVHTMSLHEANRDTSPVSTTMDRRADAGSGEGSGGRRSLVVAASVVALAAGIAIAWIGLGGGSEASSGSAEAVIGTGPAEGTAPGETATRGTTHGPGSGETTTIGAVPAQGTTSEATTNGSTTKRPADAPTPSGTTSTSARGTESSKPVVTPGSPTTKAIATSSASTASAPTTSSSATGSGTNAPTTTTAPTATRTRDETFGVDTGKK